MGRSYTTRLITIKHWPLWAKTAALFSVAFLFWWLFFALPSTLFKDPTSTVLEDNSGKLLAARIATDGQWRFPQIDTVPYKFEQCIIAFEDREFYHHPGFRLGSFLRAMKQNFKARRIVSGGSTLTMQTIRLSRKGQDRTYFEKIVEILLATRLELRSTKQEILALYASYAPFGGNVVGLEAAAWRYYGRSADQLTWAEAATLAVLPNAPSLIFPGKNQHELLRKRNAVLKHLSENEIIDQFTYELALEEPLPQKPFPLPQQALQLMNRAERENATGKRFKTSIDRFLQQRVQTILQNHHERLSANQIFNAAAIVVDVHTGKVLAYNGNVNDPNPEHGSLNDMITTPRSTGSVLKPFLYASAMDDGIITPNTLIADIPTQYGTYMPKNYDLSYSGAVPAQNALARSLNIPAVRLLDQYGLQKFHHQLKKLELSTITKSASHYGLSLILGGAEGTLWDMVSIYRNLAFALEQYPTNEPFPAVSYLSKPSTKTITELPLSMGAVWNTFEAMVKVNRPEEESLWEYFNGGKKIAWKTGTSFGFRDAWAIGITGDYVVGVWVGNADGEGRPGLTGIDAAAPILFSIFDLLPESNWFYTPYDDLQKVALCKHSGYRAGRFCNETDSVLIPLGALKVGVCPYCKRFFVNGAETYRVNKGCSDDIKPKNYFVLTPVMEWYYKQKHPDYKRLPPISPSCRTNTQEFPMRIIYPRELSNIYVPRDFGGKVSKVVFEASHRNELTKIYWHLDDKLVGITKEFHQLELLPEPGNHKLTLVDEEGEEYTQIIHIVGK